MDRLFSKPIPPPPDCDCCGAKPGADHDKKCNRLASMKAQAYPEVLDDNGLPWYANTIARLASENMELKEQLQRCKHTETIGRRVMYTDGTPSREYEEHPSKTPDLPK